MLLFPDYLLIATCCLKRSDFGAIAALTAREERFRRQLLLLLLLLRGGRLRMLRRDWVWAYRLRSNVALQVVRPDFIDAYAIISSSCI